MVFCVVHTIVLSKLQHYNLETLRKKQEVNAEKGKFLDIQINQKIRLAAGFSSVNRCRARRRGQHAVDQMRSSRWYDGRGRGGGGTTCYGLRRTGSAQRSVGDARPTAVFVPLSKGLAQSPSPVIYIYIYIKKE